MTHYLIKVAISATMVVAVSEVSKRFTTLGALLASLPLVSLLAMIWLYVDTRDEAKVAELASEIFWLVLPSLALFLVLPTLLRMGKTFWVSLAVSCTITAVLYVAEVWLMHRAAFKP
jgi:hypothetical protein